MVERLAVLRIATKHINIWIHQLAMERKEMGELAGLMKLEEIKKDISKKSLERWARRCTHYFTKKAKRMLFEEIDNMVWSGIHQDITRWCKQNKCLMRSPKRLKRSGGGATPVMMMNRSDSTGNSSGSQP